jgi:aspartate kinase
MKFLKESDLFVIFKVIDRLGLRVNMLYKSAREIQICFEARPLKFKALQRWAGDDFKIKVIENLEMLTIKNADETSIRRITFGREMVLQVRENKLYQALMR